jgi:hypothetical protein
MRESRDFWFDYKIRGARLTSEEGEEVVCREKKERKKQLLRCEEFINIW